jgi:hypothetical protein
MMLREGVPFGSPLPALDRRERTWRGLTAPSPLDRLSRQGARGAQARPGTTVTGTGFERGPLFGSLAPMFRSARFVTLFCALFTFSSCAWALYPERRGRASGGTIDGLPLVIDLLWLLAGVVPGVVCLAVDFASGAIYTSGGQGKIKVRHNGEIVVRRAPVTQDTPASMALVDGNGHIFDEDAAVWSPEHAKRKDKLRVKVNKEARLAIESGRTLHLEFRLGDQLPTRFELEVAGLPTAG